CPTTHCSTARRGAATSTPARRPGCAATTSTNPAWRRSERFWGITAVGSQQEVDEMPEHTIGTREEWQAARNELAKLEAEQAERNEGARRNSLALRGRPEATAP